MKLILKRKVSLAEQCGGLAVPGVERLCYVWGSSVDSGAGETAFSARRVTERYSARIWLSVGIIPSVGATYFATLCSRRPSVAKARRHSRRHTVSSCDRG